MNKQVHKPDVFLSYASRDYALALEFKWVLETRGVKTFCAIDDIRAGDDWNEAIREALTSCSELVLLVAPESVESDWVIMELGAAWVLRKQITPVLLHGSPENFPEHLQRFQYASLTSVGGWDVLVEQIVARHRGTRKSEPPDYSQIFRKGIHLPRYSRFRARKWPPKYVVPNRDGWVQCPSCEIRFSLQSPQFWDGDRHMTCGQQLIIEHPP